MVGHEVELDVVSLRQPLDVVPRAEPRIDLAVGQRRETAVAARGKGRKHVDAGEQSTERTAQQRVDRRQAAPERIWVRHQLRTAVHAGTSSYPLTDPWRS